MTVSDLLYSSSSSDYCDIFIMNPNIFRKDKVMLRCRQDVRIMTGDQSGDAAKSFNVNFWK